MIGESHPSITMTSQHKGFTVLQFEGKMQAEIMNYNILNFSNGLIEEFKWHDNSQDIYHLVWEWYQEPYLPLNGGMKGILAFFFN